MPKTVWLDGNSYTFPDDMPDDDMNAEMRKIHAQAPAPVTPGNIDLHSRPIVHNQDGSISTVRSKSFSIDGKETLLPTVSDDGRIMTDAETLDQFKRTGKHLGMFNSPAEATAYAQKLHEDQAAEYVPKSGRSTADIARQRLVRGMGATDVTPTIGERMKSGAGALVSGLGDLASGVVVGLPESLGNIATALPRAAYAAADAAVHGGTLGDAFRAAKNVQPHHEATEMLSGAATNLGAAATRALGGVRPGVDTDVQDAALRLAPTAAAMAEGGVRTIRGMRSVSAMPEEGSTLTPEDSRVTDSDRRTGDGPMAAERRVLNRRQQIAAETGLPEDHPAVARIHASEQSEVVPGVLNRKAWNEQVKGKTAHVASVDIDNLKPVNDNFGHLAGDSLIAANGEALRLAAEEHGAQLAHISGDEFRLGHDNPAALSDTMARANELLRGGKVEYIDPDGRTATLPPEQVKGFSHGIGTNEAAAEDALRINKAERKTAGLRSERSSGDVAALPRDEAGGAVRLHAPEEVALHPEAANVTPDLLDGLHAGELHAVNPDGSVVRVNPEEVANGGHSEISEQPAAGQALANGPANREPAAQLEPLDQAQSGFREAPAGVQAETPEVTAARHASFDNWLDTTDEHGLPVQPPSAATSDPRASTVRFYHGGESYDRGPRWLTPSLSDAQGWAKKSGGAAHVQYVDLPESSPFLQKSFDDSGTSVRAPYIQFEAPPNVANGLKPLPSSGTSVTAEPSAAEWMLGDNAAHYPGIHDDAAFAEDSFRGAMPKGPPPEPPDLGRGPGEAAQPSGMPSPSRKPAGLLARLYDRTAPQIVDAIEKQGTAGAQTAGKMRAAARFSDQFSAPAINDLNSATKELTDAQINQIGDIVESHSQQGIPPGTDPRIAAAVDLIRRDTGRLRDAALGSVADFTPIEDYLPHIGQAPENMPPQVQNLLTRAGHEARSLTRQRGAASVRPEGQAMLNAIRSYYRGASRYIGELRAFDVADRPSLDAALSSAAERATTEGYDGDLIQRYGSQAIGGGQTHDPISAKIADGVIAAQAITKPVFAPIRHFQQIRNDLASFGLGNTLRATIDTLGQKAGYSPAGARAALESGAVARDAAHDMMRTESRGGVVGALQKSAEIINTPVRWVDQIKAQVTANAAAHHYAELVDLANGKAVPLARRVNPAGSGFGDLRSTPVVQQAARDALTRAGVDVANLADPATYRQGMLNYMWQLTQDTQKSTTRLGAPAFSMTPWGRVLYTFNRPAAFGTDFVVQRVAKPAMAGDLGPLVRYTVGSLVGYGATEAAVHAIRGKPDEGTKILKGEASQKEIGKFAAKAVMPHGLSGDYTIKGLENHPNLNWAVTHSGALGGTLGDMDAIYQTGKNLFGDEKVDHPWQPLIQTEGHARTASELARILGGG